MASQLSMPVFFSTAMLFSIAQSYLNPNDWTILSGNWSFVSNNTELVQSYSGSDINDAQVMMTDTQWYIGNDPLIIQFMISLYFESNYRDAGIKILNGKTQSSCEHYYFGIAFVDEYYYLNIGRFPEVKGQFTTWHPLLFQNLTFNFVQGTYYPVRIRISTTVDNYLEFSVLINNEVQVASYIVNDNQSYDILNNGYSGYLSFLSDSTNAAKFKDFSVSGTPQKVPIVQWIEIYWSNYTQMCANITSYPTLHPVLSVDPTTDTTISPTSDPTPDPTPDPTSDPISYRTLNPTSEPISSSLFKVDIIMIFILLVIGTTLCILFIVLYHWFREWKSRNNTAQNKKQIIHHKMERAESVSKAEEERKHNAINVQLQLTLSEKKVCDAVENYEDEGQKRKSDDNDDDDVPNSAKTKTDDVIVTNVKLELCDNQDDDDDDEGLWDPGPAPVATSGTTCDVIVTNTINTTQ